MGASLNQLVDTVRDDPGGIVAAFDALDVVIDNFSPTLSPSQEIDFMSSGRELIAASALEGLLDRGQFAEAKEIMSGTPGLIDVMSPATQSRLKARIARFQFDQTQAETEARRKVATAETILGRKATPAERARLAGLAPVAGRQTVADKIREIEDAIDRPLTERERTNAAGLDTPQAVSPEGREVQDREMFIGQFGEDSEQVAAFDEAVRGAGDAPSLADVAGQRKEFTKASGVFVSVRDSFNRVVASTQDPSAAGDLALIFNYMKILDPGSVVRESEFAQAAAAGSWGQRLQAAADRFLAGKRLSDDMRADFAERAELLMQAQLRTHLLLEATFRDLALRAGFDPDDVALDYVGPLRETIPGAAPASTGQGAPQRAKPRLKFDLNGNRIGG
uniref:Structural protein n=1 Tax=uncultured organism TaxID=155900 RepID=Q1EHW5_9ZZZZ|nr:structural protein [uncultured organism]